MGERVYPNKDGWLPKGWMRPGAYGRPTNPMVAGKSVGWWVVVAPDGSACSLNPAIHSITEHEDGTISVSPSIDMSATGGWHGFLVRGEFR